MNRLLSASHGFHSLDLRLGLHVAAITTITLALTASFMEFVAHKANFLINPAGVISAALILGLLVAIPVTVFVAGFHLHGSKAPLQAALATLGSYALTFLILSVILGSFLLSWRDLIQAPVVAAAVYFVVHDYQKRALLQP